MTRSGRAEGDPAQVAQQLLEAVRLNEPTERHLRTIAALSDDELDLIRTDRRAGLAFWLNLYNAATQLLLDDRPELFDTRWRFFRTTAITVAGTGLSLDDIEHGLLRNGRSKYGLGYLPRLARTGLDTSYRLAVDPRIHFALNCGAASCPAIRSFDHRSIDETLDEATKTFLDQEAEYEAEQGRVTLPRVCLWFIGDFGGRTGLRRFLREYEQIPADATPSLRFDRYDWTVAPRAFIGKE